MEIRRLAQEDAHGYRALRLRALREHPEAFTSSHEEEAQKPVDWYVERLYERCGFRSFGIEPRAIRVEGRAYSKNHMYLELVTE